MPSGTMRDLAFYYWPILLKNKNYKPTNLYLHWCSNNHRLFQEVLVELWWMVILVKHSDKNLCKAVFPLSVFSFYIEIIF